MALLEKTKCRKNRAEWALHLSHWRQSGLTQAEYCQKHALNTCSFSSWKTKLKHENMQISSFVEIKEHHLSEERGDEYFDIVLENIRLRFRENIDPVKLRNIMLVVSGV